jgi:Cytochrome P450
MIAASTDPTAPQPLPDRDIIIEITNLIFAGTDTTGNTFSYLFWELAKHPEWQRRLREELRGITFNYIPAYQEVMKLPILDAVVQETLRFWPASPASLPRLTPDGGRIIDGVQVPRDVSTVRSTMCHLILYYKYLQSRQLYLVNATVLSAIRIFSLSQTIFDLSGGLMGRET